MRLIACALLALAGCSTAGVLVVRVDGMQRGAAGQTWMAWPDSVRAALEGLPGVSAVDVDVAHDLFRIRGTASRDEVFDAVRKLGYSPTAADPAQFDARDATPRGEMPAAVRAAIAAKRPVLLAFEGEDWTACHEMSAKTFADGTVRKLIDEHFTLVTLDVAKERDAARWLDVSGVPTVCILAPDGRVIDRTTGFVAPAAFAERLRRAISSSSR